MSDLSKDPLALETDALHRYVQGVLAPRKVAHVLIVLADDGRYFVRSEGDPRRNQQLLAYVVDDMEKKLTGKVDEPAANGVN